MASQEQCNTAHFLISQSIHSISNYPKTGYLHIMIVTRYAQLQNITNHLAASQASSSRGLKARLLASRNRRRGQFPFDCIPGTFLDLTIGLCTGLPHFQISLPYQTHGFRSWDLQSNGSRSVGAQLPPEAAKKFGEVCIAISIPASLNLWDGFLIFQSGVDFSSLD